MLGFRSGFLETDRIDCVDVTPKRLPAAAGSEIPQFSRMVHRHAGEEFGRIAHVGDIPHGLDQ